MAESINNTIGFHFGFRVIVAIEVNSYVNIRSSRLLLKEQILNTGGNL